jgi:hypothetical protein
VSDRNPDHYEPEIERLKMGKFPDREMFKARLTSVGLLRDFFSYRERLKKEGLEPASAWHEAGNAFSPMLVERENDPLSSREGLKEPVEIPDALLAALRRRERKRDKQRRLRRAHRTPLVSADGVPEDVLLQYKQAAASPASPAPLAEDVSAARRSSPLPAVSDRKVNRKVSQDAMATAAPVANTGASPITPDSAPTQVFTRTSTEASVEAPVYQAPSLPDTFPDTSIASGHDTASIQTGTAGDTLDGSERDFKRDIMWVYDHLHCVATGGRIMDGATVLGKSKAPSDGAYAWLYQVLTDARLRGDFFRTTVPKVIPSLEKSDADRQMYDDGRVILKEIATIQRFSNEAIAEQMERV